MAWLAPLEPVGYIACAASPLSATRPSTHVGTGSRSIIGFHPRPPHLPARRRGHVQPGVKGGKPRNDGRNRRDLRRFEPAFSAPAPGAVDGDLRDPVDQGAPLRVGVGIGVDHHPLPPVPRSPRRTTRCRKGPRPHRAAPTSARRPSGSGPDRWCNSLRPDRPNECPSPPIRSAPRASGGARPSAPRQVQTSRRPRPAHSPAPARR